MQKLQVYFVWIGKTGYPGHCNYNASKAGIIGFTKSAAKELGKFGIRVNCICPGFIQSAGMSSDVSQKVIKQNGLWKDLTAYIFVNGPMPTP